jgi:hypothetical protein
MLRLPDEDKIAVWFLVAIHIVFIHLWPAEPAERPMPSMFHEPVTHLFLSETM